METTIFITGATGLVARFVISELLCKTRFKVIAISSSPEVVNKRYRSSRLSSIDYKEFLSIDPKDKKFDVEVGGYFLIHSAFTRKNDYMEVKRGIDLARDVFKKCVEMNMDGVLNLSSRSVYKEPNEGCLNTEESELFLSGPITLGKYVVEILSDAILGSANVPYSNLRLASVNELKMDNNMVRPLNVFVENVMDGKPLRVIGGMQVMSFIDPRDVATAILSLLCISPTQWKDKYNIGTGWLCTDTLLNLAHLVIERGKHFGFNPVDVNLENKYVNQRAGLDITRITTDTGWKPVYDLSDMIDSLYEMKIR